MRKSALLLGILATAAALAWGAAPAQAQATRTWVSGVGDDVNPCSRTAPCKTFAGAISKTATGGEINCIDPGGFGAVTITKSISIICEGLTAGVLASGTNGIVVNAPAGSKVLLQGLDIEGVGTGLNGVRIIGSARVTIKACSIRNFTQSGIDLVGTAGARVYIIDSLILANNIGLNVLGAAGVANFGTLVNTIVDSNVTAAVQVTNAVNQITISTSSLTGSPAAINAVTGGLVVSIGPSNFLTGSGLPTSTVTFK